MTTDEAFHSGINPLPAVQDILHQISTAIIVLDRDLRIRRWNHRAESFFKKSRNEVKGKRYEAILPAFKVLGLEARFLEAMVERRPIRLYEVPVILDRAVAGETADALLRHAADTRFTSPGHAPDGTKLTYLDIIIDPLADLAKNPIGVAVTVRDATEQARLRVNLRLKTELLEIIYQVSNALHATSRLDTTMFVILSALTASLGGSFDRALLLLVDDPGERLIGRMGVSALGSLDLMALWEKVAQSQAPLADLMAEIAPEVWGHLRDLTAKVATIHLPAAEDSESRHLIRNRTVLGHADLSPDTPMFGALRKAMDFENFVVVPLIAQGHELGVLVLDLGGDSRQLTPEWINFLQMYGNHAALAIDNARAYEHMMWQAQTDSLTGLFNHGHFQVSLARMVKQAERYKYQVAVIMLDIDHFKKLNDTFGHPAGDQVLRRLAALMQKSIREADLCARYGGEEFVIVMPHTPIADAARIAERLRQKVTEETFLIVNGERVPITISMGVAEYPDVATTPEQLIDRADEALYTAKNRGRNRVVQWRPNAGNTDVLSPT